MRLDACTSRKSVAVLVDGLDKTGFTNLLCESLHARVILHNILALEKFLGRYLGLSAFGELDDAFNTPSTFSAVKCHNCVVDITAVRVQGKRMQLSESVCHLPRNDVYELRKKKWWSVLIGEWFKSALDDRSTIKPTARSSRSVCPTAFLLPGEVITKEPKIQTTQWAGRAEARRTFMGPRRYVRPGSYQQTQLTSTSALRTIGMRSSSFTGSPVANGMPRCARTARFGGGRR